MMSDRFGFYGLVVTVTLLLRMAYGYLPCSIYSPVLSRGGLNGRGWTSSSTHQNYRWKTQKLRSAQDENGVQSVTTARIPSGLQTAVKLMKSSLSESLSQLPTKKLLSIDLLTPGLNPRLENKAIMYQEYLFDVATSIIPIIIAQHDAGKFRFAKFMFSSSGQAAGFQKYCYQMQIAIPDYINLTDLDGRRISDDDDCLVFVAAKNNVGDPVINMIRKIVLTFPDITCIFLNCDLSDRVASGMQDRSSREGFRASIVPSFYFRNIVRTSRPSLVPYELGAVLYTPSFGWEVHAANLDDIHGSGSLNRFMVQAVFKRNVRDPTSYNPPRFVLAGKYSSMPKTDEIEATMSRAAFLLAKTARDAEIMGKGKDKEISSTTATTEESSLKLIFQSLKEDSQVADESLMSALRFLDKNYGRTTTTSVSSSSSSSSPAVSSSSNNAGSTISEDIQNFQKKRSSQPRPGVFDINTGTSAFPSPVEEAIPREIAMNPSLNNDQKKAAVDIQMRERRRKENSRGLNDEEVKLLDCLVLSSRSDSSTGKSASQGVGINEKLQRLENTWNVAYTISQSKDGRSVLETSIATQFKFKAVSKMVQSATAGSTNQPVGSEASSLALSGDVEKRYTVGGLPLLVSTGTSQAISRSSVVMSTGEILGQTLIPESVRGTMTTTCRIGLNLSFTSMKYFGLINQASASSADADSSVELIGILSDKDETIAVVKYLTDGREVVANKYAIWRKV